MLYVYKETISQSADIGYTEFKNFFNSIEQFLFTKDTHFCFNEEYLPLTAEEIYFKLLKKYEKNLITVSNFTTEINGQEVDVSISTDKNGKKSVEVNFKNNNQNGENESKEKRNAKISSDMNKQIIMDALNKEANKSKGDFSNKVSIFLKKFIHVKVDWERILRDSLLTELTKGDEYSW